jgi:hypothetical protein
MQKRLSEEATRSTSTTRTTSTRCPVQKRRRYRYNHARTSASTTSNQALTLLIQAVDSVIDNESRQFPTPLRAAPMMPSAVWPMPPQTVSDDEENRNCWRQPKLKAKRMSRPTHVSTMPPPLMLRHVQYQKKDTSCESIVNFNNILSDDKLESMRLCAKRCSIRAAGGRPLILPPRLLKGLQPGNIIHR